MIINRIMYLMAGSNPLAKESFMPYGPEALVVMHYYLTPAERIKGSLYLQLTQTRKLIIKVFKKYLGSLQTTAERYCLYFKETNERTDLINDGNTYRFTCKNLNILKNQETVTKNLGKLYFIPDEE